jgi:hypothetical protein
LRYSKRSFRTEELKELISSMNLLSFPYKVSFESTLRREKIILSERLKLLKTFKILYLCLYDKDMTLVRQLTENSIYSSKSMLYCLN